LLQYTTILAGDRGILSRVLLIGERSMC